MTRNKKALIVAALAALATAPGVGLAQQPQDRGGYLGLSAGTVNYKDACSGITVPCDESDTAWRFFGGYQFSRTLSLELGYANLGAASASQGPLEARYEVNAWDLSSLLSFPLTNQFAFFGRLGIYHADVDSRGNVGPFTAAQSDKNSGLTYGLGVKYEFTRSLGLRAEWQQYGNVGSNSTGKDDLSTLTVGAFFKF